MKEHKMNCPNCQQSLSGEEDLLGIEIECPQCGENLTFGFKPKPRKNSRGTKIAFVVGLSIGFIIGLFQGNGDIPFAIGYGGVVGSVIGLLLAVPLNLIFRNNTSSI